ncbi:hypothetical protein MMC34_003481 [Xylographa carneopallida]|nr:hypothetical protein [Xylographa carneopallida]
MSAKPAAEQNWFLQTRRKGPAPAGKGTFIFLRSLDVLLQYYLLRSNAGGRLIYRLGGTASPPSPALALGLSPYQLVIWTLSIGSAAKQIFWTVRISENVFAPSFAAVIAAYNTVLNTLNLLLSVWGATSNEPGCGLRGTVPVGVVLYALGIYLETVSEIQRKAFKEAPGNRDRPFSGGLFGLATNMYVSSLEPFSLGKESWRGESWVLRLRALSSSYSTVPFYPSETTALTDPVTTAATRSGAPAIRSYAPVCRGGS